jgi:tetratricopeptide (TPR) repeat protein
MPAAEAAAVVDICRQVEGLPLALELAAAWVRVLPCAAIAAELRQGTELLRAVDASRPARHASIEIVFEQSWRRLGGAERDALARLSVFSGGFSVEAARAVSGALLPVLGALADKSLLAKDGARMHLHPLVQQLAALRLDAKPEVHATTEAAHAAWFQRWLARLAHASEEGERDTLQAIDREIENVRRAWRFAVAHGQADALAACVATLVSHCEHRARFEDGLALLREAIDSPLVQADNALHALLLGRAALLELRLARYDDAQASAARALAVARAARGAREHDTRFQATSVLAGCALFTGRVDEARRLYQQALALARIGALPHDIAATLENLALAEKRAGRYDESLRLSIEALAQQRRIGNQASVALGLSNLASMYLFMHDDAAAQAHLREALALSERHGLVSTRAFVLANLTELALKADDTEAARTHAERALEVAHSTGMRALAGWLQVQLARLAARRGELDGAHSLLAGAAELALTLGAQTLKAAVLLGLAELMEARGHAAPARRVLAFGVDQEAISAPDRDELRTEWARRASSAQADPPWPGIALDELLQRIVIEREPALGGLIAALGGGG